MFAPSCPLTTETNLKRLARQWIENDPVVHFTVRCIVEQCIIAQIPFPDYSLDTVLQSLGGKLAVCLEKVGGTAGQIGLGSHRSENFLGKLQKLLLALVDGHT